MDHLFYAQSKMTDLGCGTDSEALTAPARVGRVARCDWRSPVFSSWVGQAGSGDVSNHRYFRVEKDRENGVEGKTYRSCRHWCSKAIRDSGLEIEGKMGCAGSCNLGKSRMVIFGEGFVEPTTHQQTQVFNLRQPGASKPDSHYHTQFSSIEADTCGYATILQAIMLGTTDLGNYRGLCIRTH
jgi:hypothetical protein